MAGEWGSGTLGDIATLIMGQSPAGDTCNGAGRGIPLLNGPTEFGGNHPRPVQFTTDARKLAEPGDLLFCVRGSTTGRMNWADQQYAIGRGLAAIRPKRGQDFRHFVRAVVDVNLPRLLASATGSTFPNVSKDQIQSIECLIPSPAEQKAIAHILGTLDDKIELNRKMNETLEAMAQALFKSWFIDFDPVIDNALAAGNPIPEEFTERAERRKAAGGQSVLPNIGKLFPDSFQPSELGLIPSEWNVSCLGDVLGVLETGRRPKGGVGGYTSGIPSIGAESIWGIGKFDYSKTKYVPLEFYKKTSAGRVQHNDVLLYKDGGKPGEFRPRVGLFGHGFPFVEFSINEHVFRMRSELLGQTYLYFAISDQRVLDDFANKGGKAAIPGINQVDVRSTNIIAPSQDVLNAFNERVTPLCDRIIKNAIQSQILATLRDTLLPKLLSGELRIPEAEKMVGGSCVRAETESFESLESAPELREFLKSKGTNHTGGYFHYSTVNALKGMLSNKKLHLSHGSGMNDLLEPRKGSPEEWKRLYVASFSVGREESMAMWGIYGEPLADALRVKFRCKRLRDCVNRIGTSASEQHGLYKAKSNNANEFTYEPLDIGFTIELIDVVYLSYRGDRSIVFWRGEPLLVNRRDYVNRLYQEPSFAGCLKNIAWSYEREARILVKLERELPNVKKIAIDINDALDDVEVLCGPCLKKGHLLTMCEGIQENQIKESQSLGQIRFQAKCEICKSEHRCPRTEDR